jgi:demethylmenaquinone methyltransferase/2-methoxy-6-polyprenyl-1,4-benzoquinol methylase
VTPPLTTGELPVGEEKTRRVREMFDTIAPRYETVNRIVTFGLDGLWRRRAVRSLGLPPRSLVLDIASGTGDLCTESNRQGLVAIGLDLSYGMLDAGPPDTPRIQCDAAALPIPDGSADGVISGYGLRNFTDLQGCLDEMARVVRPGGRVALLEVCEPEGRLYRAGFSVWFNRVVPLVGAALSDADAYRYLPKSVAYLPGAEVLRAMLVTAGFSGVNRHLLNGGLSQLYTATRAVAAP